MSTTEEKIKEIEDEVRAAHPWEEAESMTAEAALAHLRFEHTSSLVFFFHLSCKFSSPFDRHRRWQGRRRIRWE